MSEQAALLEQVRALPPADQLLVLDGLLADHGPPGEEVSREERNAAWHDEVVRRLDAYDRGEVKALTLEQSLERMRRAVEGARR